MALFASGAVRAADTVWTLVPANSAIAFTATYSGQEVTGEFKTFTGDIHFDPQHLDSAKVDLTIDMTSVASPDADLAKTLSGEPWFAVPRFPIARFVTSRLRTDPTSKTGSATGSAYLAEGTLALRGVSAPVTVRFYFESYGPKPGVPTTLKAVAKGEALVKRTAFGVGQGQWASTSTVADGVRITFTLTAERPTAP